MVTLEDPLGTLPTDRWNNTIIKWYERFCLPQAHAKAAKEKSPKLHNLLIRLHEFSTVIEANNATKAGDVGQLMNMWKIWCVMCQGLKGLKHYSAYLPRMVILLNELLPADLSKLLRHNLLFFTKRAPRPFHAKRQLLGNSKLLVKTFLQPRQSWNRGPAPQEPLFNEYHFGEHLQAPGVNTLRETYILTHPFNSSNQCSILFRWTWARNAFIRTGRSH
jgi:hypothetical protein